MNIALVILRADPRSGGAERYTVDLAAALAASGHAVSLLASQFAEPLPGVKFIALRAAAPTRLGRYLRFLSSLEQHLADHPHDVVHAMLPVRQCDIYHPHAGLAAEAIRSGHEKYPSAARRFCSQIGTRFNRKRGRFAAIEASCSPAAALPSSCASPITSAPRFFGIIPP